MTTPALSRGAVALKNCGKSCMQVAKVTGLSYQFTHNLIKGHKTPSDRVRGVLDAKFGIPREWWDEPAPAVLPTLEDAAKHFGAGSPGHRLAEMHFSPPTPVPTSAGVGGGLLAAIGPSAKGVTMPEPPRANPSVPPLAEGPIVVDPRGEAEALIAHIRRFRFAAETDPTASPTERAKLLEVSSRAVERLYRLTGEIANLPEARILASPGWGRIKAALVAALEPHPEALAAAVAALEGLVQA